MSSTIAAVLPTLGAQLAANVAALSAKENTFAGKVGAAQAAYANSDDAGSQSVGQVVGMLGQLGQQAGQMGQSAGAPAQALGGQTGMFGSLMQQAMQAGQGSGGTGATGGAAAGPGQGAAGPPQPRDAAADEPVQEREPLQRAEDDASGPGESRASSGPPPVTPPERPGDDDVARRL